MWGGRGTRLTVGAAGRTGAGVLLNCGGCVGGAMFVGRGPLGL